MAKAIKITINDAKAKAKLAAIEAATNNMKPIFETVGNVILNRIRLCFKLGIDPWGNPWQAIKWRAPRVQQVIGKYGGTWDKRRKDGSLALTAAGQAQAKANTEGKAGQPLRDTGRLQRSITAAADSQGVTVGTNLRQARIHQFGGVIRPKTAKSLVFPGPTGELIFAKKVTIPARPYLPLRRASTTVDLPPAWSLQITQALKLYLRAAVEKVEA